MVSNQAHWAKLSKMDAIHDAISSEFIMLDPKIEIEELIELDITGNSTVNGIEAGRIAEGGGGPGCSIPGIESTSPVMGFDINMYKNNSSAFYESPKQPDQKTQIRHDCMWAGVCADQSHPEKSSIGCGGCTRHNLLQQQQQQQQPSSVDVTVGNLVLEASKNLLKIIKTEEPPPPAGIGEMGKSVPYPAVGNLAMPVSHLKSTMISIRTPFKAAQSSVQIPAGRSLLIKSQVSTSMLNQSSKQLPLSPPASSESCSSSSEGGCEAGNPNMQVLRVPNLPRGSFLAVCEQEARSKAAQNHARPDTPLSLDDDPLEFKHNLDLVATCTIGSNQQSLLHSAASSLLSATTPSPSGGSSCSGNNGNTFSTTPSNRASTNPSSATAAGAESRTSALYGRLGGNCSCSSGSSINISSIGFDSCHTTQCYYNYLQDMSSVEDMRNKQQLRQQLMLLDDQQPEPHLHLRPCSPDSQLEQLLIDLREIECSSETRSFLLDDQHTLPAAPGALAKDHRQSLLHPQHFQHQQQQGQRTQSSLAPCGGGLSGGAHVACNKECCWSSLELSHHLASPGNERKRRHHQFTHRRRGITARGWVSDDDEDEEDDLLKQLEEDEDDFEKHFVQIVAGMNPAHPNHAWEDEEEDDDEEEDEEEESDEDDERKGDQEVDEEDDEEDEEEEAEEEEEDEDAQDGSMYGESSRSRSRTRSFRHRYHNQYSHHQHRRAARASYRTYDGGEVHNNGKAQKLPTTNLLANGAISTIIAGSGASLKSSMLGSKPSATNGSLSNAGVTSTAALAQQPAGAASNSYQATHFGDHSYTRPKGVYNMNELGVQTPSDSDEEIDVVSVGDKNLPTNPTERDYRHLQSEVASKIRTASSRGTTNGSLPYSSSSHHHHYQRQHQLADGPRQGLNHLGGIYPTPAGSTTISGANTPLPTRSGGASAASSPPPACTTSASSSTSRKRAVGSGSSKRSSNSSKRMRLGHSKRGDGNGNGGRYDTCTQALAEELDTVEKRNLHNNLERQRRIGLKNLFEELKRQIPQLRDKDRAPKVNILREAAALCTRLNQEAEQVNELRQQQIKLYERVRYLRASMHSHRLSVD